MDYVGKDFEMISLYAHLAMAEDDIKLGQVQNIDDVFDDVLIELDELQV